jgi:predicted dehydrogenase
MKSPSRKFSRRQFIATTATALAMPTFIPASALGKAGRPSPSNRIVIGIVGWGMMGPGNTNGFIDEKDCQVVAACDLDSRPLQRAVDQINKRYGNKDCQGYFDYREMMARKDIDAVMLAIPDHWHAIASIEACKQKKDIYGEKPLARTVVEQQAIVHAVQKHNRIWQTGSWQRSRDNFHKAAEIVRNGFIGKVHRVEVGLPAAPVEFLKGTKAEPSAPPPELDYETWTGPAAMIPYVERRIHMNWRWHYNYGGGQLLDWCGHHADIAHWGLDFDKTGPLEIDGTGEFPAKDALWDVATKYRCTLKYPHGVTMVIAGGHDDIKGGTKWIGSNGWVWVDRGGFDSSNSEWKNWDRVPENQRKVPLYFSRNHYRNFLDCVKSRKPTITPVETAHNSLVPGHLGLIAMLTGRKIKWDAKRERIIDDKGASELLGRHYRAPWKLS